MQGQGHLTLTSTPKFRNRSSFDDDTISCLFFSQPAWHLLPVCMFTCMSVSLAVYLLVSFPACRPVCLAACISDRLPAVCPLLIACLSVFLSLWISVCLSVRLSACLFRLFLWQPHSLQITFGYDVILGTIYGQLDTVQIYCVFQVPNKRAFSPAYARVEHWLEKSSLTVFCTHVELI